MDSSTSRYLAIDPRVTNPKPYEMHVNATIFVQDGQALGQRATAGQFFLFAHGIELALKSFLHFNGVDLSRLQNMRHGLLRIQKECFSLGLHYSHPDSMAVITKLDESLKNAKLRYDFSFDLPLVDVTCQVANAILRDTKPPLPPLA